MDNSKRPANTFVVNFLVFLLFALSGTLSTYLYFKHNQAGGAMMPGLIYTSATILVFVLLKIPLNTRNTISYYSLMFFTYLVIWVITLLSSWVGFLVGIITAGLGALITFYLTNNLIQKIMYKRGIVFGWGALAFLLTDIVYWSWAGEGGLVADILEIETEANTLYGEVFFFWHLIVGLKLLNVLRKSQLTK